MKTFLELSDTFQSLTKTLEKDESNFVNAIRESGLNYWGDNKNKKLKDAFLLIVVAKWSRYDLLLLDALLEYNRDKIHQYQISSYDSYSSLEELQKDMGKNFNIPQPPYVASYFNGVLQKTYHGIEAKKFLLGDNFVEFKPMNNMKI